MRRDRLTRSSALRAIALGAVVAPLWVSWSAASCLLADPPAALLSIPPTTPFILQGSVLPPAGETFTDWPATGLLLYVPVTVFNPTATYQFLVMEDYMTPNSVPLTKILGGTYYAPFAANSDGGATVVPVPPIPKPSDPNCHTFSLFVGSTLLLDDTGQGYTVLFPSGSDQVNWTYDPSGGLGACASYDAAGLTDSTPDTLTDVAGPDGVIVPVDSGR